MTTSAAASSCATSNARWLARDGRRMKTVAIPIEAARDVAKKYGYDQVVIIARKVGQGGGEHCTTYGVTKTHCDVAARIGDFLKFKVMGWKP